MNWSFPSNSGKPVVSFTPASDVFENAVTVTIASTGTSPVIYYTLDGSTPTTSSAVYSAPLNISATTTIKAISVDGANTSIIFSKVYTAVQNAIDDGLVYPVKSYGLGAIIFLGDVRRFEGAAWHVGIDGIMNTSDDYRVPEFDKYIVWSATQGTIVKITNTGGAVFTGNGSANYYTVTLTLGSKSYTGCNNSMPVRESAHGCPHFGTPDNSTNTFADSVENIESVCLPQAVLSLPTLGKSVVLNIVRDAGFYNVVPFGVGRAGRMSGFHELKEISSTRVNILFMNEKAGGWYPFDLNATTGKYYRDGGDQGYAEKIIESNVLTGYKFTDPKGNILVFKKSIGTNYYRVTESINPFGQKITYDYQSATFLLITDASGNRYEVTADDAIDGVNQTSQVVTKPYGSSLSKTWTYEYSANGSVSSQLFVDLYSALGYGEFKYESDIHGNPTMFQDYKGFQYLNEFDDVWRNTKSILPTGDFTTKAYNGKNGSYNVMVTDTKELITTIYRNQTPGRILTTKIITPDNVITELVYDFKGYVVQKKKKVSQVSSDDVVTTYEYNNYHYLTKETVGPLINNQISINEWDSHGNVTKIQKQNGKVSLYAYTNENLLALVTEDYGVLNLTCAFTYDSFGKLLSAKDSSGNIKTFETNSWGYLTKEIDENGRFNSYNYNEFGNMKEATDKFNHLNVYEYNQNNLITKSTDARDASKIFQYDGNNNLIGFTNQFGVLTINTFNSINKKTSFGGDPDIPENMSNCIDCKVAT